MAVSLALAVVVVALAVAVVAFSNRRTFSVAIDIDDELVWVGGERQRAL